MRLLVVEDEPDLRSGLCQSLREEGYAVDESADGRDGLDKALAWEYDGIVLDIMMPVMDGLSVLERLREAKSTPVLLLTARDAVPDRVRGLDLGADDYLVKPFQLAELHARLRALLRRNSGVARPTVEVGDVVVDLAARRATRAGAAVELNAREFALVELLVLKRGRVVTRTMIYDHLFDEHHDSMSNLVDVYVSRIRRKLGHEFVTTRRGMGYVVDG